MRLEELREGLGEIAGSTRDSGPDRRLTELRDRRATARRRRGVAGSVAAVTLVVVTSTVGFTIMEDTGTVPAEPAGTVDLTAPSMGTVPSGPTRTEMPDRRAAEAGRRLPATLDVMAFRVVDGRSALELDLRLRDVRRKAAAVSTELALRPRAGHFVVEAFADDSGGMYVYLSRTDHGSKQFVTCDGLAGTEDVERDEISLHVPRRCLPSEATSVAATATVYAPANPERRRAVAEYRFVPLAR